VTVLIASHESGPVEELAARAVTMTGGRVTAERSLVPPSAGIAAGKAPSVAPEMAPDVPGAAREDGGVAHVA
jgi:hypothetical protein